MHLANVHAKPASASAPRWAAWCGWLLALVVGRVLRVRRRHVIDALRRSGLAPEGSIADGMYRSLGAGVFELVALGFRGRASRDPVPGLQAILQHAGDQAVVVATAHTGNWDLVACRVAQQVPLLVVTKALRVRWLNWLWQGVRRRCGLQLVPPDGALGAARRALGEQRHVALMIDQAPERTRGVAVVEFFGRPAEVDLAPAWLSMRTRRLLVVAFPYRHAGGHALHLAGVLQPPEAADRQWPVQAMRQATRWLEDFVGQHPEQWLWMHRRWKRSLLESRDAQR